MKEIKVYFCVRVNLCVFMCQCVFVLHALLRVLRVCVCACVRVCV